MPLAPGQSLLHFRLVDKIGEGGMGEVWRAVDTTLDRHVAIKVLPAAFGSDPDRLARFEREAKVLASLNHTNIAAIYGFPDGASVRFLAMELVPGEDLAKILARGPLSVRETLDAARQVAAALEAAHDKGVIHRDLKPANVKRTPDGQIKVLDFGLAKALEVSDVNSASATTVTSAGSRAGVILGTASYMSPEQARAQLVDRRTDLWAFGCLVYEMLTGTKAFDGATVTDVLAAIVTGDPDWSKLPADTPATVRRLLRRCLEKDVRKRLRDAGDASLLLDDNPEDARTAPVPVAPPSRRSLLLPIGSVIVAAAGLAGGWLLAHRGGAATAARVTFTQVTFAKGMLRSARFAPDGKTIVYGAAWNGPPVKLYLARTDSTESAPIPAPPAELHAISKTGEMLVGLDYTYYGWMGKGTLARTPLLGGAPREVTSNVRCADWSPDGKELAIVRQFEGFDQLEYPVGTVLDKTVGYFGSIRISPDGERVAYSDHLAWGDNQGGVSVVDRSGKKTKLTAAEFSEIEGVAWAPGGREVWFTGEGDSTEIELIAVDLAGARRTIYASMIGLELFDIAADGRVLVGRHWQERTTTAFLAGDNAPRTIVVPGEASVARTMTPDGRALSVASHLSQNYDTFLVRSDRPGAVRLSDGDSHSLSWDGAWSLTSPANTEAMYITPTGQGATRKVPSPDGVSYLTIAAFLPDGKRFISTGRKGDGPQLGYVFDAESGKATPFTTEEVRWPTFVVPPISPDGTEAILRDASGVAKRWPIAGGPSRPIPGLLPEDQPLTFTEDGRAIFVAGRTLPVSIERVDLASGRRSPWMTLAPENPAGMRYCIPTVTPDGKHWALCTAKLFTDLFVVDGLR